MCIDEENGKDTYSATTKAITFQTSYTASRSDVMMHELFHAYQDNVAYHGGIGAYGVDASTNIKQPGFSNIEFEQALFRDIMMLHGSSATALYFSSNQSIKDNYTAWINMLTNNGTQYPDFSANWSAYETKYFEFMEEFRLNPSFNSVIINTLEPEALKRIFNGLQPNCGN